MHPKALTRLVSLAALLLGVAPAWAARDTFALGDGHSGALTVFDDGTVVNAYTVLTAPADAGSRVLAVPATVGFAAGDLVMLLQLGLEGPAPDSGSPEPFVLAETGVGRFELARVARLAAGGLELEEPLVEGFPPLLTQAVQVPEYTELTIADGGSIVARPWDGSSGGVVALLVAGPLRNDGLISASGAGFRGGAWVAGHTGYDCLLLDEPWPGGAAKGEGPALSRFGPSSTGFGNVLSGGGGGNCLSSGGGGGGHGGRGGIGGFWTREAAPAGLGGVAVRYEPTQRLLFDGGGGAGHCGDHRTPSSGGAGGGLVFLRAAALLGAGVIEADGLAGRRGADGAAGAGGAGGLVAVRVQGTAECGSLHAVGGGGGSTGYGCGGGGGGGRILAQATDFGACPTSVAAGSRTACAVGGEPEGPFVPGFFGDITVVPGGFEGLPAPTIERPADGQSVPSRPTVTGRAPPGARLVILVDGRAAAEAAASADGGFEVEPTEPLAQGERRLEAQATRDGISSPRSAAVRVVVVGPGADAGPTAPAHRSIVVGCGCGAAAGSAPSLLAAAVLLVAVARGRFSRRCGSTRPPVVGSH